MKDRGSDRNSWDKKRLLIESLVAIAIAIFSTYAGVKYGQNNNTYFYNGQKMSEAELNKIMEENFEYKASNDYLTAENEKLSDRIDELISENLDLEKDNKRLSSENESIQASISQLPSMEFQNIGLSINGEEKVINKEKSSVFINGILYYSKEFVDNLLPSDEAATTKDGMLYVGKIVKEKANLFDMPIIEEERYIYFNDSIKDTYGNAYGKSILFDSNGYFITYNIGREYSYFKCDVAMWEGHNGECSLQIIADGEIIYTSKEITNMTEAFIVDIPINGASTISIGTVGTGGSNVFISNAVVYNQE